MSGFDFDTGYDYSDPKHPDFRERMADWADDARKAAKENPPPEPVEDEA